MNKTSITLTLGEIKAIDSAISEYIDDDCRDFPDLYNNWVKTINKFRRAARRLGEDIALEKLLKGNSHKQN